MSSYKVNYSELVTALQEHDAGKANELLKRLLPRLVTYLRTVMGATPEDAEEAVHRAFYNTYEKIVEDEINEKRYIYKYLLKASRHEYIRLTRHDDRFDANVDDTDVLMAAPSNQVENMMDEERQRLLEQCLQLLPEDALRYILYIFDHPDISTKGLSEYFDLSEVNVRVKKSRIISDLGECVKRKMEQ